MKDPENCPACKAERFHTAEEWKNHPEAGHGFTKEQGWTGPLRSTFTFPIEDLELLKAQAARNQFLGTSNAKPQEPSTASPEAEKYQGDPTNGVSHTELSKYRQLAEAISKAAEEARVRRLSFDRAGGGTASDEGLAELRRKAEEAEQSRDSLVAEGMKMTKMESPKGTDPVWHWESVYKRLNALDK